MCSNNINFSGQRRQSFDEPMSINLIKLSVILLIDKHSVDNRTQSELYCANSK